jgi:hypothetical protein
MMLATLLLLALQNQTEPEAPLIPAFFTGQALYDICNRPNSGQCSMYVAGVLDGLFYAGSKEGGQSLCASRINNREAADIVTRYLTQNPQMRARAAAVGVEQALSTRLQCRTQAGSETNGDR